MIDPTAVCNDEIYNLTLLDIEKHLVSAGRTLREFGLPETHQDDNSGTVNREVLIERAYSRGELQGLIETRAPGLTQDQREAHNSVMSVLYGEGETARGNLLFLDAPGGTGKTWLINLILAEVRFRGDIALAVASSGIAATLLEGGRTAHSRFKLPLNLAKMDTPTCNIPKNSDLAALLRQTKVIVWDECTMMNRKGYEALDRSLRDVCCKDVLFGGITVLLAGDFCQTLPVIPKGTPADEIKVLFKTKQLLFSQ